MNYIVNNKFVFKRFIDKYYFEFSFNQSLYRFSDNSIASLRLKSFVFQHAQS